MFAFRKVSWIKLVIGGQIVGTHLSKLSFIAKAIFLFITVYKVCDGSFRPPLNESSHPNRWQFNPSF